MATFADAIGLFPRNVPLAMRYSEALLEAGNAAEAHKLMLDLLNNVRYTPQQVRLLAMAANGAGDEAGVENVLRPPAPAPRRRGVVDLVA